MLEGFPTLL